MQEGKKNTTMENTRIFGIKGYDLRQVTRRRLEKGNLGEGLSTVVEQEILEHQIKEALEKAYPVFGFFKKGKLWGCYIFEVVESKKSSIEPVPEIHSEMLKMYSLKYSYIHPNMKQQEEKMMAAIFTKIKQCTIQSKVFQNKKTPVCDGFILQDRSYVYKTNSKSGIPTCFYYAIAVGIGYGMFIDNIPMGVGLGCAIGLSGGYGTTFLKGTITTHTIEVEEQIK